MLPVIFLLGPTAVGKTDLAIQLTEQFPLEIISVDSAMIYRGMDIGTGKPEPEILSKIPHHLVDILDPSQPYSAAKFCEDVYRLIPEIHAKGKIPFLVGGTMLYFRALLEGLSDLPCSSPEVRAQIFQELQTEGLAALYQKLQQIDPNAAAKIKPQDSQRIQRALEVYLLTGQTPTAMIQNTPKRKFPYPSHLFGLFVQDRAWLHQRILERFELMLKAGFIEEVKSLYARDDLTAEMPSVRAVGYRQIWKYLEGEFSENEMKDRSVFATRQLAKRQMTWMRSWPDLQLIDSHSSKEIFEFIAQISRDC